MTKSLIGNEDSAKIEKLLASIQPEPGQNYYDRMSKMPWNQKRPTPFYSNRKKIGWSALAVIFILAVLFMSLTPAGHAIAGKVVELFARAETDAIPQPEPQLTSPVATPTAEPITGLALVEAASIPTPTPLANVPIPMGFLPEGSRKMTLDEAENASGINFTKPYLIPAIICVTDIVYLEEKAMVCLYYVLPRRDRANSSQFARGKISRRFRLAQVQTSIISRLTHIMRNLCRGAGTHQRDRQPVSGGIIQKHTQYAGTPKIGRLRYFSC